MASRSWRESTNASLSSGSEYALRSGCLRSRRVSGREAKISRSSFGRVVCSTCRNEGPLHSTPYLPCVPEPFSVTQNQSPMLLMIEVSSHWLHKPNLSRKPSSWIFSSSWEIEEPKSNDE